MKPLLCFSTLFFFVVLIGCGGSQSTGKSKNHKDTPKKYTIAIHGGAGNIKADQLSDSVKQAYRAKLKEAITTGHRILKNGGSAVKAVQKTINVMENSPLFNAGKGAVLTHAETVEMDAAIMDGKTLNAGAVAGVKHIKNPIDLAASVMTASKHVMLYGPGAEEFARDQGFDSVPQSYFITKRRLNALRQITEHHHKTGAVYQDTFINDKKMGTVGCVALDQNGNLAAGTSTGGLTDKKFGRIGDSPIIGAGTYANNKTCAVSCTGIGEYYIRGTVAYDVSALMEYSGLSVTEAAHKIIHEKQPQLGGEGGIIAMDNHGTVSLDFNTPGMFRAKMDEDGSVEIAVFGHEN